MRSRQAAARRRPRKARVVATDPVGDDGIERLEALLDAAARLDLHDRVGWARLRDAARVTIGGLVAGGRLPRHLVVVPDDPPVLVTRTIGAAWRHASMAPPSVGPQRAAS